MSVVPGLPADEALEQQLADLDRLAVGDAHRIERDDVGGLRDDERTGIALLVQRVAGIAPHSPARDAPSTTSAASRRL